MIAPSLRPLLLLALLGALAPLPSLAGSTPDDQARFLAGLPAAPGDPLESLERSPSWRSHAAALAGDWALLGERLGQMEGWAAKELWPRVSCGRPVLYLFGGPDAITPVTLYPNAPVYVLAGLEPIGRVSAPEALPAAVLGTALDGLHEALRSVVPASFFRTIEMGHDLRGKGIDGVQPIVYLFLARAGAHVLSAERIEIDPLGFPRPLRDGEPVGAGWEGLRVRFQRPGRPVQTLVYVRGDLANDAVASQPGFAAFVARLGPTDALLKAASFILHDNRFSRVRDVLLRSASTVLQDDSGLPLRAFQKGEWTFVPYGTYLVPKRPFQRNWQPELDQIFKASSRGPLPFRYGYRRGAVETNLLFAEKKGAANACAGR